MQKLKNIFSKNDGRSGTRAITIALLTFVTLNSHAEKALDVSPWSVIVPSLNGDQAPSERVAGQLYYDTSLNVFKGVDTSGSVQSFLTTDVPEKIFRARITGSTDYSNCISDPCTIITQSGSWLTSVNRLAAGSYRVTWAPGFFSIAPSCSLNGYVQDTKFFVASHGAPTGTSFIVTCHDGTGANLNDCWFDIICMGPK